MVLFIISASTDAHNALSKESPLLSSILLLTLLLTFISLLHPPLFLPHS